MAERVQIILEAQDLTSGVMRGVLSQFGKLGNVLSDASDAAGRFGSFMKLLKASQHDTSISTEQLERSYLEAGKAMARLGETIAVFLIQTFVDAIKVTAEYNKEVRDLALISGTSAEASSRFLQVLDDYELTAEDATAATKALKEKGLVPTIETLAMLADQYKKIKDPAEKMKFVQDNLGRGGAKWVNVLNQESDALLKTADSINKYLIKTDEQIKKSEISRLKADELKDSWEGFKNAIGDATNEVVFNNTAQSRAYAILEEQGIAFSSTTYFTQAYKDALEQAKTELLATAEASIEYTESLEAQQAELEAVSKANKALIDGAIGLTRENEKYEETQQGVMDKIADLRAEGEKLYPWEHEKIEENRKALEELGKQYFKNRDDFVQASKERIAMMSIEKIALMDGVEGYSQAEYELSRSILERTDIATAAAFEQQQAMDVLSGAVATSQISVEQFGEILDQTMADGVLSVDEVTAAINRIPTAKTVAISIQTIGGDPAFMQQSPSGQITQRRAGGGSVSAGKPYFVGEQGMELFVPNQSGNIVPNNALQNNNEDVIAAIMATRLDERKLARSIVGALARAG